jgi:pre-mRNA-processing factor 6
MVGRQDFLNQPAPENYVAGLGRGATGFTTRSDLGPAREGPSEQHLQEALAKRARELGAPAPTAYGVTPGKDDAGGAAGGAGAEGGADANNDDERFQDPDNEVGLFANGFYDKDDDEADRIYQAVDEKMEKRRKARRLVPPPPFPNDGFIGLATQIADMMPSREAREKKEREDYEAKNPKISQQFADAKRALSTVTDEEWASIPEVGDLTGRNKRQRQSRMQNRFYAVPDSVIAAARDSTEMDTSIAPDEGDGSMTNFAEIGAAREKILQVRLEQAEKASSSSEAVSGTSTTVDPRGYLTSLDKSQLNGAANVGDVARTRSLLESVIKTNPKHPPGWISAARLEEVAGKAIAARRLINQGTEHCPKSEDVWLEAIRLHMGGDQHNSKVIAANALSNNPRSVKLWIAAMELESDPRAKKRVIRQALDQIPQSVALWKAASNLEEDPADARLLLSRATEFIPLSIELWLALARLESPDNARKVLNKARKAIPSSYEVWIAACRLEEQLGAAAMVRKIMDRAIKSLAKESAMLKREEWIAEAEKVEQEGAPLTCAAIIEYTLGWDLDEDDDRKDVWMADAKESTGRGRYETARAMYAYALRVFVNKAAVWQAAAELERAHGTRASLQQLLTKAVEACPKSDDLWLQLARERWAAGELDEARKVLGRAFSQNPSENIWLAAVKLEADGKQYAQARELLARARQEAGTDRVWVKSVAFERAHGDAADALALAEDGLALYPAAAKLWMQKGQLLDAAGDAAGARAAYAAGVRAAPRSEALWLLAARLEERAGATVRARSLLDRARLALPRSAALWAESVGLERRAGNEAAARAAMALALQALPASGLLWAEKIMHLEARTQRKARALEAIRRVDNDAHLFVAVARIFWAERKLDKAVGWFERAIVLDADLGDTWAWYYKFLMQHGTEEKMAEVREKCAMAEPRHGEVWARIAKDPKNAGKSVEEVLLMAVAEVE